MTQPLQTLKWAADELQVSYYTVLKLIKKKKLPGAVKIGGAWRIRVEAFNRFTDGEAL